MVLKGRETDVLARKGSRTLENLTKIETKERDQRTGIRDFCSDAKVRSTKQRVVIIKMWRAPAHGRFS